MGANENDGAGGVGAGLDGVMEVVVGCPADVPGDPAAGVLPELVVGGAEVVPPADVGCPEGVPPPGAVGCPEPVPVGGLLTGLVGGLDTGVAGAPVWDAPVGEEDRGCLCRVGDEGAPVTGWPVGDSTGLATGFEAIGNVGFEATPGVRLGADPGLYVADAADLGCTSTTCSTRARWPRWSTMARITWWGPGAANFVRSVTPVPMTCLG